MLPYGSQKEEEFSFIQVVSGRKNAPLGVVSRWKYFPLQWWTAEERMPIYMCGQWDEDYPFTWWPVEGRMLSYVGCQ